MFVYKVRMLMCLLSFKFLKIMMKKILFVLLFLILLVLGVFYAVWQKIPDLTTMIFSDSWVNWTGIKTLFTEEWSFYQEQVQPYLDQAKDQLSWKLENLKKDVKDQYNQGIDQLGEVVSGAFQKKSDDIRETVRGKIDNFKIE